MIVWMLVLGIATGMRTMTPMAVLCWFMWLGLVPMAAGAHWIFWTANIISAIVFTVFALGEYFGDTLARTPDRRSLGPLLARVVFAALVCAILAAANLEPVAGGVLFGAIGALIGTFGGYALRKSFATRVGNDLPVALGESLFALVISVGAMHMIAADMARQALKVQ